MKYGYFDNISKEYVISTYDTPLPWINYLTNGEMFTIISNLGGGYSYFKDAKLRRITRYQYNSPSRDNGGLMIYIDDQKDIFSPTFYPAKVELDKYECHVGMQYQRFISKKNDLEMDLLCFVPLKDNVEIAKLTLKNSSKENKKILLYAGVEFCLWDAVDDSTNFQRNFSTGEVEVRNDVIIHKTEYRERRNHFAYFATSGKISSYETDRDTLLGLHGDYCFPKEIKEKKLSNKIASGWAPVAFNQIELSLKPNEEVTIIYLLGYMENKDDEKFDKDGKLNFVRAEPIISRLSKVEEVDKEFTLLKKVNEDRLIKYQISSSDENLDTEVNIWHQYQCLNTYLLSRSASYFESGIGRGMGFRDSCQDLLGFVHMMPDKARERLIDIASIMKKDGSTYHQYQPLDKKGNSDIGDGFNDDPLWLIAGTYAYLSETRDFSILDELIPYNSDKNELGSFLEHLTAAVYFTINHLGPHGLPLIGHADWNDCLNLNCFSDKPGQSFQTFKGKDTGIAESVFIAGMFVKYGKEYLEILSCVNKEDNIVKENIEKMKEAIYRYGFEDVHFLRAYDAYGHKVGSNENEEGKIYIEPQGMCVMAGLGLDNDMANKALETTYQNLNTKYGICILSPCYSKYHIELGEVSSYPKGYKENGGIFCHNNPWIIIAECINDNPERAFTYYKEITPSYLQDNIALRKVEPYVYCQMVGGKEAINFGEGKNSWLTGTASWTFVAISQYILGIRPTLEGLVIDPKMPKEINSFTAKREFLGHMINISAKRGEDVGLYINGQKIEGNIIKDIDSDMDVLVIYR